jgi:hypothetical protein
VGIRLRNVLGVVASAIFLLSAAPEAHALRAASSTDHAIVTAGTLKLSDLPAGWRQKPRSSSSTIDKEESAIPACQKIKALEKRRVAHGASDDFLQSGSNTEGVSNSVGVYRSAAITHQALRTFNTSSALSCFNRAVSIVTRKESPSLSLTTSVDRLSVDPIGDGAVGFEITLKATKNGLTETAYFDLELVQVGRAGITFEAESLTPSLSAANDLRATLLPKLVDRVRGAGA